MLKHPKTSIILSRVFILFLLLFIINLKYGFFIARVTGNSMYPTYSNGQLILCRKSWDSISVSDVIIFKPVLENDTLIKRVAFFDSNNNSAFCISDNVGYGATSDDFGTVTNHQILGTVLYPNVLTKYILKSIHKVRTTHIRVSRVEFVYNNNK